MKSIQRSSSNVSFALNAAALAPYDPQLPFGLNARIAHAENGFLEVGAQNAQ